MQREKKANWGTSQFNAASITQQFQARKINPAN